MQSTTFLPVEIFINIFRRLDWKSLLNASLVCWGWKQILTDNSIWKKEYLLEFYSDDHLLDENKTVFRSYGNLQNVDWKTKFVNQYKSEQKWKNKRYNAEVFCGHRGWVRTVDFADDILYSGSNDTTIIIRDLRNHTKKQFTAHIGAVTCVQSFRDQNRFLSSSNDGSIKLWHNTQLLHNFSGHRGVVFSLHYNNGQMVSGSKDTKILLWDIETCKSIGVFSGHGNYVSSVKLDRNIICSGSWDRTVKLWDKNSMQNIMTLEGHTALVGCVGSWENIIVSGSRDETIRRWDVRTGKCFEILKGHSDIVLGLDVWYNKIVSCGGENDKSILLWNTGPNNKMRSKGCDDLSTLEPSARFLEHQGAVFSVKIDENQMFSSSADGLVMRYMFK